MEEAVTGRAPAPLDCPHPTRVREYNSGFASAETVCVDCGQSFDHHREQELRASKDAAVRGDASHPRQY